MKILVVEDTKTIAQNIKKFLELEYHSVVIAENGLYALEVVRKNHFDMIILDLMLPGLDGLSLCKKIKKEKDIPIIMATAKGQLDDKLDGFACGADDYLVKPFDLQELVARISALGKRIGEKKDKLFIWKDIKVDIEAKEVYKKNKEIKLSTKEFLILEYLINNVGIAVSRSNIIDEIRGGDAIREQDGKLDVYISTLRKKIDPKIIETIKGFGYKINKKH